MESTLVNINEVKENPENPRLIKDGKFKKLVESIKEFPQMLAIRPIVVNDDMIVLGGNMRLKACKAAGLTEIHIIKAKDLTLEQQREFIIKDNSSFGEWDWSMIKANWDFDLLSDWGLDIPKFPLEETDPQEDGYDSSQIVPIITKEGDLIEIGDHKLLCGSSTVYDDVKKLMGEKQADMCFTDPPYNMSFSGTIDKHGKKNQWGTEIKNDSMSAKDFKIFLDDFVKNLTIFVKGAFYITFYRLGIGNLYTALTDNSIQVRSLVIWKKNNFNLSNSDYKSQYEPIFYGWIKDHNFYGELGSSDIWEIDRTKANKLHPTMKPVNLIGKAISDSSKKGDLIIDFFLGSGSTMVAAHQMGRICYGIELDPKYCDVIIDRMRKLDPSLTIKLNGKII
jgi:DNA modification methylase